MNNILSISDATYMTFADLLVFNLNNGEYLSDTISVVEGDVEYTLSFTVVASYSKSMDEEAYGREILSNVSPVWWTFKAVDNETPVDTDFSFDELRTYILC